MLVGRFVGGLIGSKVSSRVMMSTANALGICLILAAMFLPATVTGSIQCLLAPALP